MKQLSILLLLSAISFSCFSQQDPKAQEVLKGVSTKYKSYKSLSASFKLNILDKNTNKFESQTGSVVLKGDKYHLSMADQEVMSDGNTMWTFLKESNEVQVSEALPEDSDEGITPANIFTMYEKGFKTKYIGEKSEGGKGVQQIELYPEDNTKNYIKILISISKKDKYISAAKVFDKNGNIYTYTITKFTPNAPAADDLFSFNKSKHPNVEVVDLR